MALIHAETLKSLGFELVEDPLTSAAFHSQQQISRVTEA